VPGCDLDKVSGGERWFGEPVTEVWFIREEERYLRPAVDAGGIYYLSFHTTWDNNSQVDPEKRIGRLLLTPSANSKTLHDFAQGFFHEAMNACIILGTSECTKIINALAQRKDPDLREAACKFLKSQFQQNCTH
jgi:hypothetical protein